MDVRYELNGTLFVWNDEKARLNILNHEGIGFEQAAEVLFDPFLQLETDRLLTLPHPRPLSLRGSKYPLPRGEGGAERRVRESVLA